VKNRKCLLPMAGFILAMMLVFQGGLQATQLTTVRVASGLSAPVFVTSPPGDFDRLFIVEQTGRIRILTGGEVLPNPFLDISDNVSYGGERGLLGLAFHPDYTDNGFFYVNYTDNDGNTVIARFSVSDDPNLADPSSDATILTIDQPYGNHNGGMIAFGPQDGYLYIGMGDGGSGGDPENRAQDDGQLLGKLLRIDVDGGFPYAIPPDNPFAGPGDPLDEIWAKGLRNPWRFSFDRETYDLYIGDVGQNLWEEIDFQPAASQGGENYGWRLMEGNHCYNPPSDCDPGGLTYPIYEYSHGGSPFRCSITGGYVYRGSAIPDLAGTYFFADYCSNQIWSFRYVDGDITEFTDRTDELDPGSGMSIDDISSFGQDANGELYIIDLGGEVFKIVPVESGCIYTPGDCNHNGVPLELGDVVTMTSLYRGSADPEYTCPCPPHGEDFAPEADPNGNCVAFELGDVVTEIAAYRGTGEASGCGDCPGTLRLSPTEDQPLIEPSLKANALKAASAKR
jgi:glucose/arabinose dehydrogenase